MLLFYSINIQAFVRGKSSFISQFINGKSRDFTNQKLQKYFREMVTSIFKVGTGGGFASPSLPGPSGVFDTNFISYVNDYILKDYHQHFISIIIL